MGPLYTNQNKKGFLVQCGVVKHLVIHGLWHFVVGLIGVPVATYSLLLEVTHIQWKDWRLGGGTLGENGLKILVK